MTSDPTEEFALAEIVLDRAMWETIARERHAALEKLQADRSHATIRSRCSSRVRSSWPARSARQRGRRRAWSRRDRCWSTRGRLA